MSKSLVADFEKKNVTTNAASEVKHCPPPDAGTSKKEMLSDIEFRNSYSIDLSTVAGKRD